MFKIISVQFSHSVVSDSLWPHESHHARPPCPSPTPGVHSNSCPLSRWRHPAISSSVIPFSSCPQSLPASEFFPLSQLFAWGAQSTGVSALASFLPKNTQGWSPLFYFIFFFRKTYPLYFRHMNIRKRAVLIALGILVALIQFMELLDCFWSPLEWTGYTIYHYSFNLLETQVPWGTL